MSKQVDSLTASLDSSRFALDVQARLQRFHLSQVNCELEAVPKGGGMEASLRKPQDLNLFLPSSSYV